MSYVGSYVWQVRQKVGDMRLLTATVDTLAVNEKGEVKLVYAPHVHGWSIAGGHVELGDTWRTAALHELEEEAGIVAKEEDLTPFAAMSGPKRIYEYQDGTTQPFTLCFVVKTWQSEGVQTDTEEVPETRWVPIDEALTMQITSGCRQVLLAYREYIRTGEFQMVDFR